ncbi:MAG: hypothetical protein ACE5D4_01030 [Thermodesulfobacteriota bacterium]
MAKENRLATARGEVSLEPRDLVMALFILGHDKEPDVAAAARKSFSKLSADIVIIGLNGAVEPLLLKTVAMTHADDDDVLHTIALHENCDDKTLAMVAAKGPESVAAIIANNGELLRAHPSIIEALKGNPHCSKETLAEAVRLSLAGEDDGEEEGGPADSRKPDTAEMEEPGADEDKSTYEKIKGMNVAEKVKAALLGNKEVRDILIKERNQVIATSVLRNPRITDEELIRVAKSRESSEEMLRVIAGNKKYLKNYAIKRAMVTNPKTPLHYSLKFINVLHAKDIRNIAKSRNVPGPIAAAARRIMDRQGGS